MHLGEGSEQQMDPFTSMSVEGKRGVVAEEITEMEGRGKGRVRYTTKCRENGRWHMVATRGPKDTRDIRARRFLCRVCKIWQQGAKGSRRATQLSFTARILGAPSSPPFYCLCRYTLTDHSEDPPFHFRLSPACDGEFRTTVKQVAPLIEAQRKLRRKAGKEKILPQAQTVPSEVSSFQAHELLHRLC